MLVSTTVCLSQLLFACLNYCLPVSTTNADVTRQATLFINGGDEGKIFDIEDPDEALQRLTIAKLVCAKFKSVWFEYKNKAHEAVPEGGWDILNSVLFLRLDAFLERLYDVLDMFTTIVNFSKLEKIDIGGTKGKTLTNSVIQIHTEYSAALDEFRAVPYDILDVDVKAFDSDFYKFR